MQPLQARLDSAPDRDSLGLPEVQEPKVEQVNVVDLYALLEAKHREDKLWFEVKDGPTWGTQHLRLDALAMPTTWRPFTLIGYEIKRTRGDWLRDEKWNEYRKFVHLMYLVCPQGVVQPEELPEGVGLYVASSNGARLFSKRKAVRQEIEVEWSMLAYLLMRTKPERLPDSRENRVADWLRKTKDAKELGRLLRYEIGGRLAQAQRLPELIELDALLCERGEQFGGLRERVERLIDAARGEQVANARRAARHLTRAARAMLKVLAAGGVA
jgi:hypothetical protein